MSEEIIHDLVCGCMPTILYVSALHTEGTEVDNNRNGFKPYRFS